MAELSLCIIDDLINQIDVILSSKVPTAARLITSSYLIYVYDVD